MFTSAIANALVFLPLVFGQPTQIDSVRLVRHEATNIEVYEDGSFTLSADGNVYAGCLPTVATDRTPADCNDGGSSDDITLFEDGSAIWHWSSEVEIAGCFLPSWGCQD